MGKQCFPCWKHLKTCGQTRKHCFRNKNVSKFVGKHFASWEANFVSAAMFPEVGNIGRKHNVSATMFSSLPRAVRYGIEQYRTALMSDVTSWARFVCLLI